MKPLIVRDLAMVVSGECLQGSENQIIQHAAYRIKQVKNAHTAFFTNKRILDWGKLEPFYPLILVTDISYKKSKLPSEVITIKVSNAEEAYWKFVQSYRNQFSIPVVAVTGTTGKSTTKEMIKHIVSSEKK